MFTTHADGSLIYITADSLSRPGLAHAFTTRAGGVSRGIWSSLNLGMHRGDDYNSVLENYRIICSAIGTDETRTVFSKQVHRDGVKVVAESDAGYGLFRDIDYEADALVTNVPGMTLVIFSADCVPVLLFDPVRRCIGAAHAGWRGTALGTAVRAAENLTADPFL
jgi:copper oxidase (laccase) domain-containing protein